MARGNEIIVNTNPRGVFTEGYVKTGETHYPGMIVQVDASVALQGGRHTFKIYAPGTDGEQPVGAFWVVLPDWLQGKVATAAYIAGDRLFLYSPVAGEEINLLFGNSAGTADDIAVNDKLMVDTGTGKVVLTTGSPETEVAVALEALVDPTADTLIWTQWTGH